MTHKLVSLIPHQGFKQFLYKKLFGYSIGSRVHIGRSIIKCKEVHLGDNVAIGNGNVIATGKLIMNAKSRILTGNRIIGKGIMTMGEDSRIIYDHYIDVWNNVTLGNHTWLAGKNSQIWTHGSLHTKLDKDLSVTIGDHVYIGSAVRIAPGVTLKNTVLVGLGSVVTSSIEQNEVVIAGNPATVVKKQIDWRTNW